MHPVRMPPLGTTSDELRIVGWLKAEGEEVAPGEVLLEVESDKATLDVEATAGGTLLRIERQPGETVQAGALVGWIGVPGEAFPETATRKEASPAVRKLARELGVDLDGLAGSGPGGRVERKDVLSATGSDGATGEPLPPHRQQLARRLARSTAIPQFTVGVTVDATRAVAEVAAGPDGFTFTHVLLQAIAATLRDHPALNALWAEGGRIRRLERFDAGLAVAGDDSLYVVTIPEPDGLPAAELVELVARSAEEARAGRASRSPAAVILSNLGGVGVDRFEAILDPDATAVLAAGRVSDRPLVAGPEIRAAPQLDLALTVDHRVADGVAAGRFLAAFRDRLEAR